jgi:hypothetical protein
MTSHRNTEHEMDDFSKPIRECQERIVALEEQLRVHEEGYQAALMRQRDAHEATLASLQGAFTEVSGKFQKKKSSYNETIQSNAAHHHEVQQSLEDRLSVLNKELQIQEAWYQEALTAQTKNAEGDLARVKEQLGLLQEEYKHVPADRHEAFRQHQQQYEEYVVGVAREEKRLLQKLLINEEDLRVCDAQHKEANESYHQSEAVHLERVKKIQVKKDQLEQAYRNELEVAEQATDGADEKVRAVKNKYLGLFKKCNALKKQSNERCKNEQVLSTKKEEAASSEKEKLREEKAVLIEEQQAMARQIKEVPNIGRQRERRLEEEYTQQSQALERAINKLHKNLRSLEGKAILERRNLKLKLDAAQQKPLEEKKALEDEIQLDNEGFFELQGENVEKLRVLKEAFKEKLKAVDDACQEENGQEVEAQAVLKKAYDLDRKNLEKQRAEEQARIEKLEQQRLIEEKFENKAREERLAPVEEEAFKEALNVVQHLKAIIDDDVRFAEIEPLIDEVIAGLEGRSVELSPEETTQRVRKERQKQHDLKLQFWRGHQARYTRIDARLKKEMIATFVKQFVEEAAKGMDKEGSNLYMAEAIKRIATKVTKLGVEEVAKLNIGETINGIVQEATRRFVKKMMEQAPKLHNESVIDRLVACSSSLIGEEAAKRIGEDVFKQILGGDDEAPRLVNEATASLLGEETPKRILEKFTKRVAHEVVMRVSEKTVKRMHEEAAKLHAEDAPKLKDEEEAKLIEEQAQASVARAQEYQDKKSPFVVQDGLLVQDEPLNHQAVKHYVLTLDEQRARLKALVPKINDAILPSVVKKLQVMLEQKQAFSEPEANKLVKQLKSMVTSDEHIAIVRSILFKDAPRGSNEKEGQKQERIERLFFRLDREIHDVNIVALIEQLRAMTEQKEDFSIEGAFALVQALKRITDRDIDFMSAIPNIFDRCAECVIKAESSHELSDADVVKATKIRLDSLLTKLEDDVEESKQRSSRFNRFTQAEAPKENEASGAVSYVLQCLKHVVTLMMYPFRSKPKEVTLFAGSKPQKSAGEVLLELKQVNTKLSIFNNALLLSSEEEKQRGFDKK